MGTTRKIKWKSQALLVTYGTARDNLNERRNSPTAVSYQLTDLEEFTVYYVQVFAETSVSGKRSAIVDAKTSEDGMASNFECFVMLCYVLYSRTVIWDVSIQMRHRLSPLVHF